MTSSGVWVELWEAETAAKAKLLVIEKSREKHAEEYLQNWIKRHSRKKGWFRKAYTPTREYALSILDADDPGKLSFGELLDQDSYLKRKYDWHGSQAKLCENILKVRDKTPTVLKIYLTLSDYNLVF